MLFALFTENIFLGSLQIFVLCAIAKVLHQIQYNIKLFLYCRVYSGDIKSGKDEIWFDDVDPDVIEKATGVKQRKLCEDDNVHTHAHTCGEMPQNEQVEQEPR
jgi:hypothetical protein